MWSPVWRELGGSPTADRLPGGLRLLVMSQPRGTTTAHTPTPSPRTAMAL